MPGRMQMKRLLLAAAALVALMINAGAMDIAAAQTRGTTCTVNDPTGSPLNVRNKPNGTIVGALHNGTGIFIVDVAKDDRGRKWAQIEPVRQGKSGWIFGNYIDCEHDAELFESRSESCNETAKKLIARDWPNVKQARWETRAVSGCVLYLEAPSPVAGGKFAAWIINVKNGRILAEFYGPENGENGICHYLAEKSVSCDFVDFYDEITVKRGFWLN
jgi:hypothetical protein